MTSLAAVLLIVSVCGFFFYTPLPTIFFLDFNHSPLRPLFIVFFFKIVHVPPCSVSLGGVKSPYSWGIDSCDLEEVSTGN